jgi:hypothetical protein
MPNYVLAYHGGSKPETPEQGAAHMARWKVWVEDLGDAMVNPGTPMGMSKTVTAAGVTDDGGPNPLSGFSIVSADSMEAAIEIAKNCPFIEMDNASIELAEAMQMPG